ncbi:MAG: nucleotidyltransferase domain-containing protein [Bacteroidia bacterium]|nr:nucleotidyltransferase domain-containing protein [Bacteroidia bacterium]
MKAEINSIAIYGSRARKDYDIHSDNDLLIVADSFDKKYDIELMYNNLGYSCSAYTFDKLKILSDKKALFVQHLKQDAKILKDDDNRLNFILDNYTPKENYNEEITETINYFEITKFIPDTVEGIGWAFDVIAIGLRNYNILQLANHKIYEFSLPRILNSSKSIFNLTEDEITTLVNTRIAKKNFREKYYSQLPSKKELIKTINILEKRYSISISPTFLPAKIFNEYAFDKVYNSKEFTAYQKLRLFEAFIMTSPLIKDSLLREKCRRIIESPKFYASSFNDQNYIDNLLIEIINVK